MGHLSIDSKHAIVQKALERNGRSLKELAQSHNIGYSTLQKWIRRYRNNVKITTIADKSNKTLSQAEKFQHLVATGSLNDVEIGVYCREQGIYSFELKQWKESFMTQKSNERKHSELAELKLLRAENKELKREIHRKDRALAETTALLVLKKSGPDLGGSRGRLIPSGERKQAIMLVSQSCKAGARKRKACELLGLSVRTLERWEKDHGTDDKRDL